MKAGHIMPGERARVELELPGQLSYMHVHGEPEFFEKFGYDPNPIKTLKRISKTPDAETVPGSATAVRLRESLKAALKGLIES